MQTYFERTRSRLFALALGIGMFVLLACGGGAATPRLVGTATPANGEAAVDNPAAATDIAGEDTEAPAEQSEEATPQQTIFAPGDVINIDTVNLVVLGWEVVEGTQFAQPDEGNRFVAVELLMVNAGEEATGVSSLLQMELKDSSDRRYDIDFAAASAIKSAAPDGELAPGERVRGKIGFQVPEDATGLTFVFDASMFRAGRLFVELGDEPMRVDAPAQLPGEAPLQSYAIGEAIELGDVVLTVNGVSSPEGNEFSKPDEGFRFIVVDLTVENKKSEAVNLSSLAQMELKDSTGQRYSLDIMATTAADGSTPDGELAAGERIRGQVGYSVPEDADGLIFVFDGGLFSAGKIFVTLE
jgi:hypothetical protein